MRAIQPRVLYVTGFLVAAMVAMLAGYYILERRHLQELEAMCSQIAQWADRSLAPGAYASVTPPPDIRLPTGSHVNVVKRASGDVLVLLKNDIGWKENYDGVLYSTLPLRSGDIVPGAYGREELVVPNLDDWQPLIRERVTRQFLRVDFDLN